MKQTFFREVLIQKYRYIFIQCGATCLGIYSKVTDSFKNSLNCSRVLYYFEVCYANLWIVAMLKKLANAWLLQISKHRHFLVGVL